MALLPGVCEMSNRYGCFQIQSRDLTIRLSIRKDTAGCARYYNVSTTLIDKRVALVQLDDIYI